MTTKSVEPLENSKSLVVRKFVPIVHLRVPLSRYQLRIPCGLLLLLKNPGLELASVREIKLLAAGDPLFSTSAAFRFICGVCAWGFVGVMVNTCAASALNAP